MSRTFEIAAAALIAALLAPTATAQSARQTASIEVSYADLDLSAKAGAQTLLKRMKAATAKICGERPSPRLIQAAVRHTACTNEAMKNAVAAIDVPMVTTLFNGKTGGTEVAAR